MAVEMGPIDLGRLEELRRTDPAKAELAELHLARIREAREQNPLLFFKPHDKGKLFLAARTTIKGFLGGNQSGKTIHGVADDLIQAVDEECLPDHLKPYKRFTPPFLGRIVTPDFTSTMEGVVFEKLKALAPKDQLLGGGWDKAYDKQNRKLRFANGSWIDFLTYEQDLDKFGGATLDRVHFDEEPPGEKGRKIYLQAWMRRMARGGDIVFTMTPELGMSWSFDEVFERRDEKDLTVVQVSTDDNPYITSEQRDAAFARMSDEEQEAKRHGRFVAFGGLVVNLEDRHVVDPVSPEHVQGLTSYVIIDPGAAQGAVLWVGFDKDDVMLCFDELYPTGQAENRLEVLTPKIKAKNQYWGIEPAYLIDPSSRNALLGGGPTVEDQYYQFGIYPSRARNNRFASVMQLRTRAAAKDPPGLLLTRDCPKLRWELGRWRVAEDEITAQDKAKRGQGRGDTFATVGPDHLADCARYGALEWFWGPPETHQAPSTQPVWVPGTAPSQDWFNVNREASPMGSMS